MSGFNDMSTLLGHFVLSPREREKRDRIDSRGDERQGRKKNRNVRKKQKKYKQSPSTLTCYSRPCPPVSQYQLDSPVMKGITFAKPNHPKIVKCLFVCLIGSQNCYGQVELVSY